MSRPEIRVAGVAPGDASVVPVERDPVTGRSTGFDRNRKHRRQEQRPSHPPSAPTPAGRPPSGPSPKRVPGKRTWLVVGAAAVTAAVIVGAVLITGGSRDPANAGAAQPTVATGVSATTAGDPGATGGASADSGTAGQLTDGTAPTGGSAGSAITSATSSAAASGTATGAGAGSTAGVSSPSSSPASSLPGFLDPARIAGYTETGTYVVSTYGGEPQPQQGTSFTSAATCGNGICRASWVGAFPAATHSMSEKDIRDTDKDFGCFPTTITVSLRLDRSDGSYTGRYAWVPKAEKWRSGGKSCETTHQEVELRLVPIVRPDLSAVPAGTPEVLDPGKIQGYQGVGTSTAGKAEVPVSCEGGICQINRAGCEGLCAPWAMFEAATPDILIRNLSPRSNDCGLGSSSLHLVRSDDGSYSGSIATTYEKKVDAKKCPKSVAISLRPVT